MKPEPTNKPEAPMSWEQCFERAAQEDYGRPAEEVKQLYAISTYAEDLYERAAQLYKESHCREAFHRGAREQREICSGDPNDFERDLYDLVKRHINAGLKRPDLIHKLEYVTQSCRVS